LDLVEREAGRLYHTTFVVGPEGDVIGRYRKVHLTEAERRWATPGTDYLVVELPFGNVGVMVGHEVCFFEVARILTCLGADLIAAPSAWRAPREERLFLRERALENKVFIVAGNRVDAALPGASRIVLPNAAVMSQSSCGQTDYTFGYLNLVWARDKQIRPGTDLVRNRRPELYGRFVEPSTPEEMGTTS
ncbi:MAG: carbon-nitrogen hydrolase family protein, partial [Candidatus Rokubacteria bacterium]|nr:carbon-nitrogen hydrolase family protein [Candidatus Rokubacteria bacterium]